MFMTAVCLLFVFHSKMALSQNVDELCVDQDMLIPCPKDCSENCPKKSDIQLHWTKGWMAVLDKEKQIRGDQPLKLSNKIKIADSTLTLSIEANAIQEIIPPIKNVQELRDLVITSKSHSSFSAAWLNMKKLLVIQAINGNLSSITSYSRSNHYCETLKTVIFTNNHLSSLPEDFITGCTQIQILDLSSNRFTSIPAKIISSLPNLIVIKIQRNKLQMLEPQIFYKNTQLQEVDLSQNSLKMLPLQMFGKPNRIRFLNLSSNDLSYLPEDLLSGSELLEELSLAYNKLTNISSDLLSNSCSRLRILHLQSNNLNYIPEDLLKNCTNLYYLNLYKNPLKSISPRFLSVCPKLSFLSIDKNHLQTFPQDFLINCKQLQWLSSSYSSLEQIPSSFLQSASKIAVIVLRNNNLQHLPSGFLYNTSQVALLDLSRNKLKSLFPENFNLNNKMDAFSELKIDLSYNEIEMLPKNIFQWSYYLIHLDLSHNHISDLLIGWDRNINLQTLNLSYNNLTGLRSSYFIMLSSLQLLNLSRNKIKHIDETTFYHLEKLIKLDLSFNELHSLTVFPALPISMQNLNISNNNLSFFPCVWGRCNNLTSVDISKNIMETLQIAKMITVLQHRPCKLNHPIKIRIEDNPGSCDCPDTPQLLTELLEKDKIKLDIRPCKEQGKRFGPNSHQCYDSGVCPEKCFCNATIVNCKNLQLQNIPVGSITHPTMLFLQNNIITNGSGLENIQWQFLELLDMNNALESSNSTTTLNSMTFKNFSFLDTVSLSSNQLISLREDLLWNLPKLKYLDISNNLLTSLPRKLFQYCYQLQQLDISNNNIESIEWDIFNGLSSLRILILKGNFLSHISSLSSSSLTELDFSQNKLHIIEPAAFTSLPNLKMLDLSHNNLSDLEGNTTFDIPQQLKVLLLRNNSMKSFPSEKWILSSISILDVSDNQIPELEMSVFSSVNNNITMTINLTKNKIKTVNFTNITVNETEINIQFILTENMLLCDCELEELISYIKKHGKYSSAFSFIADPVCHEPIIVKDKRLSSLLPNELLCPVKENCPSPCLCFNTSDNGVVLDCNGRNLSELPIQIPSNVQTLYLEDNAIQSVESLKEPKWENLKKLFLRNCCTSQSPDLKSLNHLHHLRQLQFDPECHCRELDFVQTGITGISGECQHLDRRPSCFLKHNESRNDSWGMVQCSNEFRDLQWQERTVCFVEDQCSNCDCYLNANHSLVMNCSNRGLLQLPDINPPFVEILDFSNNNLTILHDLNKKHWQYLTKAIFHGNFISKIANEMLPSKMSYISLENNKMKKPSGWLSDLMKSSSTLELKIVLKGNPLICDCNEAPETYADWSPIRLERLLVKKNSTFCERKNAKPQTLLLIDNAICDLESEASRRTRLVAVSVSMVLTLLALLSVASALYYKYRKAVHIWCFVRQYCQCACTELQIDDDKEYDAFLSYSSEDAEFIAHQLLPGLEDPNLPHQFYYKICIHDRDWPGGDYIPEQIVLSVQKSRRVIIVLTENFLRSSWATLEFKVALQQALQDKINRLIIVVPGELPSKDDMDPDLRMYVTMNTYLIYNDSKFWDKLRYSMPHKTAANLRHLPKEFIELMEKQNGPQFNNIPKIE